MELEYENILYEFTRVFVIATLFCGALLVIDWLFYNLGIDLFKRYDLHSIFYDDDSKLKSGFLARVFILVFLISVAVTIGIFAWRTK